MKEKVEKIYNITTGIALAIYAIIGIIFAIFIPKYSIFFKGWWTLLFAIPALGQVLFQSKKGISLYILISSVLILLSLNGVFGINKCFTILLCLAIMFIGINIVMVTFKIPNKIDITKYVPFYYSLFSSAEEKITSKFVGGNVKVIFGYLSLDLSNAKIEKNSTIKIVTICGETEVFLPEDTYLTTSSSNLFGGTENQKINKKGRRSNNVCIETINILGNTKIK